MRRQIGTLALVVLSVVTGNCAASEFQADFEAYTPGVGVHGRDGWKGWDNVPGVDGRVSNLYAYTGRNSLQVLGTTDIVHEFNLTGGVWVLTAMQYIPHGGQGTTDFILLNRYQDGGPYDWSVQTEFDLTQGTITPLEGTTGSSATIRYDQWVEIRLVIDLAANTFEEWYNGVPVSVRIATGEWDDDAHGTLQALDLYGNGASSVYYDDVKIDRVGTAPTDCCGLQPGDRVRLLVSNPNGAVNLPIGTLGTVMGCYQGEYTYAFVSWDNWSNGTTSCEQCSPPVWLPSPSGKSVLCSQIQPVGTSPPTTNVDLYDAGESYRSFSPRTFQAGQSGQMMEIYFRIGNKGTDVAPSHVIRFYASTDTRITASDYFIAEETLEPLSPNQTQGWRADNLEFPVNVPAGEYYIGWIIDPDNRIAETDETNNTAYKEGYRCTVTGLPAGQPDLVDAGESYRSFTPRTVEAGKAGQTLTICSTVRNQGTGRAEACAARCYASQDIDITAADYLLCQQQVPALDPGGTYSFCCSSAFPTTIPAGVYYVGWIIDASYQVTESDETNNRAYKQGYQLTVTAPVAAQPDLHDQGESGCGFMPQTLEAGKPGQSLLIWSNVVNTGTAGANACKVRCYASQDTQITPADARLAEISLPALGAGTSLGIRASEAFPTTIAAGTYYVGWIIDADNQVPESNEDNNVTYKEGYRLIVTAPSEPDLCDLGQTYQSVDPDPPVARIEDGIVTPATFRVHLKVGNQGTGKSPACTLRCYASTDTAITAADILLGQVEIPALAGGDAAELVIEAACSPGTAQGFYTIGWIIDAEDQVPEKDETNNTGFLESPQLLVHYPTPI
jgi:subtilase family serine protease